jgi:hypothetical protein
LIGDANDNERILKIQNVEETGSYSTERSESLVDTPRMAEISHQYSHPSLQEVLLEQTTSGSIVHQFSEISSIDISHEYDKQNQRSPSILTAGFLAPLDFEEDYGQKNDCKPLVSNSRHEVFGARGDPTNEVRQELSVSPRNPKTALKEYYDQCEPRVTLTKSCFVCIMDTSEGHHIPFFTSIFVSPQSG